MSKKRKHTGGNPARLNVIPPAPTPMRLYLRSGEFGWNCLIGLITTGPLISVFIRENYSHYFLLPALVLMVLFPFAKKVSDWLVTRVFSARVCEFLNGSPRGIAPLYFIFIILPLTLPLSLTWFIYCHRAARKIQRSQSFLEKR